MKYIHKPLEELDVLDDFLINAIASDKDVGIPFCRTLLSVLLQRKIENIRVVAQRTIPAPTPNLRGIRMDVEIEEYNEPNSHSGDSIGEPPICNIYDLEPHLQKDTNFPRHNRFYQAKIDGRYLKSGEHDFSKLPNLYVLTIINFDPFGYDYMMYTIRNKCEELPDMDYDDGIHFIYFYTGGSKGGCKEIKSMLQYLQKSTVSNVTDNATQLVHDYVSKVKVQPEVKLEYMKFDEIIYYAKKEAAEEAALEAAQEAILATYTENILSLLEDCGEIPVSLRETIQTQTEVSILKDWFKLAAKTNNIEDFMDKVGCN